MSDRVHESVVVAEMTGVNDNDVLCTVNATDYDTWILGSTAGAMDVFVSLDGTNFLASAVALEDMVSTTPATRVVVTAAGRAFKLLIKCKLIRVLQNGATGVANGRLVGYRTT